VNKSIFSLIFLGASLGGAANAAPASDGCYEIAPAASDETTPLDHTADEVSTFDICFKNLNTKNAVLATVVTAIAGIRSADSVCSTPIHASTGKTLDQKDVLTILMGQDGNDKINYVFTGNEQNGIFEMQPTPAQMTYKRLAGGADENLKACKN
jgi:hypothetical protein